ncbi:MAG: long-chain fatty acid--CoA ligase, partial [Alphaproteobacteria bacterium]|nr:long-chain fatty acid--CoA ligase [Alphaproteobacteria bacterium]
MSVFDLGRSLLASVIRMPDAVAISDGETVLSYAAWQDDILRLVAGLDARGLRQGDHFVTVLQNRYEAATLHM